MASAVEGGRLVLEKSRTSSLPFSPASTMRRARPWPFLFAALTLTCACRTTPSGPLGAPLDFSAQLPPGLATPALSQTTLHRAPVEVGADPALVEVQWRTFEQGGHAYVLSAQAHVLRPARGLELSPPTLVSAAFPRAPDGPDNPTQSVTLRIAWERRSLTSGSESHTNIEVRGDGSWR